MNNILLHEACCVERAISLVPRSQNPLNSIDLVMATDSAYFPFCCVTLASVLSNCQDPRPLRLFLLLAGSLSDEQRECILKLKEIRDFSLREIVVESKAFDNLRTTMGITAVTYYRLLIHKLLPQDCVKVVYLDSDVIVEDSIAKLYDTDVDGYVFAGVEDSISTDYNRTFGMPEDAPHINAGVLVMNVEIMRNIGFDEVLKSYLSANQYRLTLGDQQIINEIFYRRIKLIDVRWNLHGGMFYETWRDSHLGSRNKIDLDAYREALDLPGIIHYTLKQKPWVSMVHPKSDRWFAYLEKTNYRGVYVANHPPQPVPQPTAKPSKPGKSTGLQKVPRGGFSVAKALGVIKSLQLVRLTRLTLEKHVKEIQRLSGELKKLKETSKELITQSQHRASVEELEKGVQLARDNRAYLLKDILTRRLEARKAIRFRADEFVDSLPSHSTILSNVQPKDLDGGYAENVKTLVKTNRMGPNHGLQAHFVMVLSQRLQQDLFWDCLRVATLYDRDLYFMEVAFFGAFSGYFDPSATAEERKCFGFSIDDLGYYFDGRQPSRVEAYLNDPAFQLSSVDRERASFLIRRVVQEGLTKYNKYQANALAEEVQEIAEGCILIIDQKRGDASIEFAGADDARFEMMLEAAVRDNPDVSIYFKRHPDSIHRNMNSYRNRRIKAIKVLPDGISILDAVERCSTVYTVSSQVGFEALLRGKKVVVFGFPFFAGWGLTDDRVPVPRRNQKRTIEDLFHVTCILLSVYLNPKSGRRMEIEEAFDHIGDLRKKYCPEPVEEISPVMEAAIEEMTVL